MTMTSFVVALYGHCCRRHIAGQRVVSNISAVRSCWSICSLSSESNNTNLLLCLLIAVLGTSILLYMPNNFTYNMAACTWWPYRSRINLL